MNSEAHDISGWLLAATASGLAILGAMAWSHPAGKFFAGAIVTLVAIERRRAKIVTAAMIRVTDEKGEVRGLVAWNGEGIQVGVRADSVSNSAMAHSVLWQNRESVAFTFRPAVSIASGRVFETVPAIGLYGQVQSQSRSYSVEFSYEHATNKPALRVAERTDIGTVIRSIPLQ